MSDPLEVFNNVKDAEVKKKSLIPPLAIADRVRANAAVDYGLKVKRFAHAKQR